MRRIPSLDGLRAISISLVVVGHWAELRYHSDVAGAFANLGVRIFFIISGYLITTLLLKEREKTETIGLREFYVRRAYRILPAAFVFMLPVFVVFFVRHELRWYHAVAAALYVANFDFAHPWFLGHLWSLSVEEQFYFLWPGVLKKWWRHRVAILAGVVAFAPVYRVACHLLGLHGQADETFPAVADVLAIGCLLAVMDGNTRSSHPSTSSGQAFSQSRRDPSTSLRAGVGHPNPNPTSRKSGEKWGIPLFSASRISALWAAAMLVPVIFVPVYVGRHNFHITALLLFVLWPAMHLSIAGLLKHVVERPYGFLNARPIVWLGQISYSLYLWQQVFIFGEHAQPWHSVFFALGMASASFYLVERPMLRLRERRVERRKLRSEAAVAA